jgi:uncharacterized protein YbbC (DUF1343 family)
LLSGLDVLIRDQLVALRGARLGLVTHDAAVSARGQPGRAALLEAGFRLERLFGPEHGLRSQAGAGEPVDSATDPLIGLPAFSLYGAARRPTPEMLVGLDAILYDLQDIGVRPYTYVSTMALVLEAAGEAGLPVWVLDRPDPLTGRHVEGMVRRDGFQSFVGYHAVPLRYGLTPAELARWSQPAGVDLHCVAMEGWDRRHWWDQTGRPWLPPSPAIRTPLSALAFAATVLIEGTLWSEGRGTPTPFEVFGGPQLDHQQVVRCLQARGLPGVRFAPTDFMPDASKHAGVRCNGVRLTIVDREAFRPARTGICVLEALREVAPIVWNVRDGEYGIDRLAGTDQLRLALDAGGDLGPLLAATESEATAFAASTRGSWLYGA